MKRKCYILHVETENFILIRWSGRLKKFIPRGATADEAPDSSPPVGDSSSISPSDQKILVALESCVSLSHILPLLTHMKVTLINPHEGYAFGLCNRIHPKQNFPVVFGQVLIDVHRCWGENVRNVKSLNPFSLGSSEPLGPIFPASELDYDGWVELLVLRGRQSMCNGCLGAGS